MLVNLLTYTHSTSSKYYKEVPYEVLFELQTIEFTFGSFYRGLSTKRLLGEINENIWTPKGLCSTSKNANIAKSFAYERGGRGSFIIIKGKGKDISSYSVHSREEEVIIYQQQFSMFYCGQRDGLDVWLAIELGVNIKPTVKTYPHPKLDHIKDISTKSTCLMLNEHLNLWDFSKSSLGEGASFIGEVKIENVLYKAYKYKEHKWSSITSYFLEKDKKVLELKLDWNLDKYDHIDKVFV